MAKSTPPGESRPILYVECATTAPDSFPHIRAAQVEQWLRLNYVSVNLGEIMTSFPGLFNPQTIDYVKIADINSLDVHNPKAMITLADATIEMDLFHFHETEASEEPNQAIRLIEAAESKLVDALPQARITTLPSQGLRGLWGSMVFRDGLDTLLLRFILRMVLFSLRRLKHGLGTWNRLILCFGPPGTGKTTLCRALAQQLSIRLGKHFPSFKLVEIDAQSLFTKFFGESGKAVGKLFDRIESILDEDEHTFICVFIDEIESLANTRQHLMNSNEPQDSLRAVNALLVALDHLRSRSNVLVLCTSNLIDSLDPAFLDRIDKKQYVPLPCAEARYEILRARYLELALCGILAKVRGSVQENPLDLDDQISLVAPTNDSASTQRPHTHTQDFIIKADTLPSYDRMMLRFFYDEMSWPRRLWDIAERSTNLSGRTLHKLPMTSLATYAKQDPCPMDEALEGLSRAIDEELLILRELVRGDEEGARPGKRLRVMPH